MRTWLISAVAAAVFAGPALAAPPSSWTGPYGGFAGGLGWGSSNQSDPGIPVAPPAPPTPPPELDGKYSTFGGTLGGTAGYNWQMNQWVFGVEGDFSWANIGGQSNTCGTGGIPPHSCGARLDDLGTFRGRIGYAPNHGEWLFYATGGLAVGELRAWDNLMPASGNAFRPGWTVGGGVEAEFAPRWSVKLEYLFVNLGSAQLFYVAPNVPETVSFNANIIRLGVNYNFAPVASTPVVTKY